MVRLPIRAYFTAALLLLVMLQVPSKGSVRDTLRSYDPLTPRRYITNTQYVRQVQRFSCLNGTLVHSIRLYVSGKQSKDAGTVRLYGDEGGLIVPRLRENLGSVEHFAKTTSKREWITIEYNNPISIAGNQFFVEVEFKDTSLRLMSDSRERIARCMESTLLPRLDQIHVNPDDSTWTETPYGYYVEVHTESPDASIGLVKDTIFRALDIALASDLQPLSCGDINGDGFIDVASTSQLHLNEDGQFRSVSCDDGKGASYLFFWDIDGDNATELAAMRLENAREVRLFKLVDQSLKLFRVITLPAPCSAQSMIQFDVDRDAVADVVLMSKTATGHEAIVISGKGGHVAYVIGPMAEFALSSKNIVMSGVDVNRDGQTGILCRSEHGVARYTLSTDGSTWQSRRALEIDASNSDHNTVEYVPSVSVSDNLKSGTKALLPRKVSWRDVRKNEWSTVQPLLTLTETASGEPALMKPAWWSDNQGPVLCTDLDNDDQLDFISFQDGGCGLVRVFSEQESGYVETTGLWGLNTVSNCTNGICADFDQDGHCDLMLMINGKPELFRNRRAGPIVHALRLQSASAIAGTTVKGMKSAQSLRGYSGRDRLIQDATSLYISDDDISDSVQVQWGDGRLETFAVDKQKRDHLLIEGAGRVIEGASMGLLDCSATFNNGSVVVSGLPTGVESVITVRTLDGVLVNTTRTSDSEASIALTETSSGKYLIAVASAGTVCSTMLTIVR